MELYIGVDTCFIECRMWKKNI